MRAASRDGRASTAVLFPYDPVHQTFVNIYEDGALRHQAILDVSRHAVDYYAGTWQGTAAVLAVFVPAGIEHILIGPDHVLFLIGLLLLGGSLGRWPRSSRRSPSATASRCRSRRSTSCRRRRASSSRPSR